MSKYLSLGETANLLRISRSTLYRHLQNESTFPKPFQVGGRPLFLAEEIDAWVKRQRKEGAA